MLQIIGFEFIFATRFLINDRTFSFPCYDVSFLPMDFYLTMVTTLSSQFSFLHKLTAVYSVGFPAPLLSGISEIFLSPASPAHTTEIPDEVLPVFLLPGKYLPLFRLHSSPDTIFHQISCSISGILHQIPFFTEHRCIHQISLLF